MNGEKKIYSEKEIKSFPKNIPLAVKIEECDGKIFNVKKYRHFVNWKEGGKSAISYCNNCGSALLLSGWVKIKINNKIEKYYCNMCAGCNCFQGRKTNEHIT